MTTRFDIGMWAFFTVLLALLNVPGWAESTHCIQLLAPPTPDHYVIKNTCSEPVRVELLAWPGEQSFSYCLAGGEQKQGEIPDLQRLAVTGESECQ